MKNPFELTIVIRGAGDLASGVALRLWRSGFRLILTELPAPLCIRRTVAFSSAVYTGSMKVEEAEAVLVQHVDEAKTCWERNQIPLLIDPDLSQAQTLHPDVIVDARVSKFYRSDIQPDDAPLVIGIGPGFTAQQNVTAVIESNRGHHLGRVFWQGSAEPDTGLPGLIGGEGIRRVLKTPCAGIFQPVVEIGDSVTEGDLLAHVDETEMRAAISGIVRGVLMPGTVVSQKLKVIDIDPRSVRTHCFTVSDKASAIGGGVLEAILTWCAQQSAA